MISYDSFKPQFGSKFSIQEYNTPTCFTINPSISGITVAGIAINQICAIAMPSAVYHGTIVNVYKGKYIV